jgi:class I fructose-bisphosphate aldolase
MAIGKQIRLNRLFAHPSGRFCSVAVDHFVGYAHGMPEGLIDLRKALSAIVAARPCAVTMQKGTALTCWAPHAGKVPMIIQSGCFTPDDGIIETLSNPEECVRLGADAIAIAIGVRGPNEGRFIKILSDGVDAASRFDLPVIAHIYPREFSRQDASVTRDAEGRQDASVTLGGKIVHDPDNIAWAVRVGIECGADVIKVAYTGDVASFSQIVACSPVPVVAAGGPQTDTLEQALQAMSEVVESGAKGATIGRNVWGHGDIGKALRAFKAVILDRISPAEAISHAG